MKMRRYGVGKALRAIVLALFCLSAAAQNFTQRGFIESDLSLYPKPRPTTAATPSTTIFFAMKRPTSRWAWLRLAGAFDARFDTHEQTDRSPDLDWQDRTLRRPALALREFNATITKGKLTAELGKQFIRWGKADILNPTDRFAPKDFLTVTDPDFLAVMAARVIYDTAPIRSTSSGSRSSHPAARRCSTNAGPCFHQPWTGVRWWILGSEFPGALLLARAGITSVRATKFSASFYDGFNSLPVFQGSFSATETAIDFVRTYPELRLYGADAAVPLRWFTVKTEAAYYTSPDRQQDEYVIYVIQFERQIKELSIVAGYAGDAITARTPTLQFSPELGFARAILAHAQYTIDSNRSVSAGSLLRSVYSQSVGQHWRVTTGLAWLRGVSSDFLGQYHRNSYALLALRYSF
jgi:hypothetical protein